MIDALQRLALGRAEFQRLDSFLDSLDSLEGVAFQVILRPPPIDNHHVRALAALPIGVTGLDHTPKRGGYGYPPLGVDRLCLASAKATGHGVAPHATAR